VQFECEVVGEITLGTHIMFLGGRGVFCVRTDVTPENPLEWCPWPIVDQQPMAVAHDDESSPARRRRRRS
jgi:hypothetical protein